MTAIWVVLVTELMKTLAYALADNRAREIDDLLGDLFAKAWKLRNQVDQMEHDDREHYLDALEALMTAAQQRIRPKRTT